MTQVDKTHYTNNYDSISRWISYYYQINLTQKLRPQKALEIGIGNRTVTNYLQQNGTRIETCDFDKTLNPDHVADIRDLPFEDNSYDLIMACQILEHLPWEDVDKALSELSRVTSKNVIISIPYSAVNFEAALKFPFVDKLIKKPFLNLFFRIPHFFMGIKFNGEHYWEMGRKGYSARKIRKALKQHFKIKKEVRPVLNPYHYFFVLEKL